MFDHASKCNGCEAALAGTLPGRSPSSTVAVGSLTAGQPQELACDCR